MADGGARPNGKAKAKPKPFSHNQESPSGAEKPVRARPFGHHASKGVDEEEAAAIHIQRVQRQKKSTKQAASQDFVVCEARPAAGDAPVGEADAALCAAIVREGEGSAVASVEQELTRLVPGGLEGACATLQMLRPPFSTESGNTPLTLAIDYCQLHDLSEVVRILLAHGADPNAPNVSGETPLGVCAQRHKEESLTPLEKAQFEVMMGQCISTLLEHRADPNVRNRRGKTAIEVIESSNKGSIYVDLMRAELSVREKEQQLAAEDSTHGLKLRLEALATARSGLQAVEDSTHGLKLRGLALSCVHRRPRAHFEAYASAVELVEGGPAPTLEFAPDGVGFVAPISNSKIGPLKKVLETADVYLQRYGALPTGLGEIVFGRVLELHAAIYEQYTARYSTPEAHKALAVFVGQKVKVYYGGYEWCFQELIAKREADDLAKVIAIAREFPPKSTETQTTTTLMETMEVAACTQRRLLLLARRASGAVGGGATHLVVRKPDGWKEPGLKRLFRSHEKVCLGTPAERLFDVCRAGILCDSMAVILKVLQFLLEEQAAGSLVLVRMKMRFQTPSGGGWRDALVNVYFADDPARHICEIQVMHRKLMTVRADMGAHNDYAVFRSALEVLEYHRVDWESLSGQDLDDEAEHHQKVQQLEEELRGRDRRIRELEEENGRLKGGEEPAALVGQKDEGSEEIIAAFRAWDTDGDGTIQWDELKRLLMVLNPSFKEKELQAIMKSADKNGDGVINYQEFSLWLEERKAAADRRR